MVSKKFILLSLGLIMADLALAACQAPAPFVGQVAKTDVVEKTAAPAVTQPVQTSVAQLDEVAVASVSADDETVVLHANLTAEPPTLDPSLATDSVSLNVIENLFMGLTNVTTDGTVEPELARNWGVSDDGLTYTFQMRDDASWVRFQPESGVEELGPVTAFDVVYGAKRTCDPRTGSGYAYVNYIIAGCKELNTADPAALTEEEIEALLDAVGVTAPDTYTVRFTVNTPAPYFPAIAGLWVNRPQYREVIEANGEQWIEPGSIVTNGPYVLTEWHHGDSLVAERNPYWYGWSEVDGNIDRVELVMIGEQSTAFSMYQTGALDTAEVPLPDIQMVQADALLTQELTVYPTACTAYIGFITTKPPMDDVLVRKALSAAIDRKSLVENVLKGGQTPANTFAPSMIYGNAAGDTDIAPWALPEEMGGWGYDKALEQARQWLAEAGYPNGEGFPAITVMHAKFEDVAQIVQAIQSMWQQGLGITVDVDTQEFNVFLTTIQSSTPVEEQPHTFQLAWCADYADENNWVHEVFNTDDELDLVSWEKDGNEPLGPEGESFNQLTGEAQQAQDPEKREELYKAAEKILVDDAAAIAPTNYFANAVVTKPYLRRTYPGMGGAEWQRWVIDWGAKKQTPSE